jgi:cytochrome P450
MTILDHHEGAPAPFYPPLVKPARRPLRFPLNLIKLLHNNLELIPEAAYREPVVIAPGPPRLAFFTGLEAVKTLLLSQHADFPKGRLQVDVLKPIFGNAMISAEAEEWRWQRAVAAPLFRHEELLGYGAVMTDAAEAAVSRWRAAPPDAVHAIHAEMMRAAFHVISHTMLAGGADDMLSAIEKGHADYYSGANWWVMYTMLGLPHWLPRPGGKSMRAHEKRLRAAVAQLVKQRRNDDTSGEDLLARMARSSDPGSGKSMADENVVDNIVAFLMAGYDTTAFALTWTLYLISQSPEWEARMLAEVEQVVGDGPVTAGHAENLTIVKQVLNESLRLFPTAPIIVRDIMEDRQFDGVKVPAGTIGIIPIYAIHRHRSYWTDPDRFDPGRFAVGTKYSRFQFMPFGAGPRICIGAAFAMIEATIMLATFIRAAHFELERGYDPRPAGRMFLVPSDGLRMRVTLRQ